MNRGRIRVAAGCYDGKAPTSYVLKLDIIEAVFSRVVVFGDNAPLLLTIGEQRQNQVLTLSTIQMPKPGSVEAGLRALVEWKDRLIRQGFIAELILGKEDRNIPAAMMRFVLNDMPSDPIREADLVANSSFLVDEPIKVSRLGHLNTDMTPARFTIGMKTGGRGPKAQLSILAGGNPRRRGINFTNALMAKVSEMMVRPVKSDRNDANRWVGLNFAIT